MMWAFIFLVFLLFCVSALALVFFLKIKRISGSGKDLQPFDAGLVLCGAAVFAGVICFLFSVGISTDFDLGGNIGQVGDFIGGLTNPILSFIALMVLLRTTLIQTNEARKSTSFLERQNAFLEKQDRFLTHEKFESTFFQILNRLDSYCEVHLRAPSDKAGVTEGGKISNAIRSKRTTLTALSGVTQYRKTRDHVVRVVNTDLCIGFSNRAMRALRLINNADISSELKLSFSRLLIDSLYPYERVILCSHIFFHSRSSRNLLRRWGFPRVKEHVYACDFIRGFYEGELGALSYKK